VDSTDLKDYDIDTWFTFTSNSEKLLIESLPSKFGIYAIHTMEKFGRLYGKSDIIYIGSATSASGLKVRIKQYFHPGRSQFTNLRIGEVLRKRTDLMIGYLITNNWSDAKELETSLLNMYEKEHGELPPLNRQG